MAHERMFDFPKASGEPTTANALYVGYIRSEQQPSGSVLVFVNFGGIELGASFASTSEAQDFVALWTARAENAR